MSKHTCTATSIDLQQFLDFVTPQKIQSFNHIKSIQIRSWFSHLITEGISPRTVHRKASTLRSFFLYLRKREIMNQNPMAKVVMPKLAKQLVKDIPAQDLKNMFQFFPWHEHENGNRDKILLLLFYASGMRLSELISIEKKHIDFYRNNITVLGKRNKQRIIPLHPEIAFELKDYAKNTDGIFLFMHKNKPLYPMYVYRLVTKYLQLFSKSLKTSPHVLRHSFATHMLNNGANLMAIKELLGHSSLQATQVYTKNNYEKLKAIYSKAHPRER